MTQDFFNPLSDEREEDQQRKKDKRVRRIQWLLPLGRKLWAENLYPMQIISDLAKPRSSSMSRRKQLESMLMPHIVYFKLKPRNLKSKDKSRRK